MSTTLKFAVISSTLGLFVMAAAGGNAYAAPDGHEQARQLLQRSEAKTEPKPAVVAVRVVAPDGREQARRMIEGRSFVEQAGQTQNEAAALIVQSKPAVDGHTAASNLLARPLGSKTDATGADRIATGVDSRKTDGAK